MPAPIRMLVCVPVGAEREAIATLMESLAQFEIVGFVEAGDEVASAARRHRPDVLVLDEALAGTGTLRLARRLAQERPLPTLLLVEDVAAISERDERMFRQLRMHPMPKAGLRLGDAASLSFARTRLMLLASRAKEPKATLDKGAMSGILTELRAEAKESGIGSRTEDLARSPRDVIVVAGAREAETSTAQLLRRVGSTRVPVLVTVDGLPDSVPGTAVWTRALEDGVKLRRATGIYLAPAAADVFLGSDLIACEFGIGRSRSPARVIESATQLGSRALVVSLSPGDPDLTLALDRVTRGGGATGWLADADGSAAPRMPTGSVPLTMIELVWLLQQTAPHRA